jgi:phage terminase large subunit-like protein
MNYISAYVKAIDDGLIVGRKVERIYRKLLSEIEQGKYEFDEVAATKPILFAEKFCVPKDSKTGRPIKLELFQKAFIQAMFGIKKNGKRRFREVFLLIARKNGKTTLLAIVMLYMLIADDEQGAEVYSVATKLDQARKAFDECVAIVNKSPELRAVLRKRQADIFNTLSFGYVKPLASDSNTLDGLNSHCVIVDELHAIRDRKLYEVMFESMGSRTNPMFVMITTAGTVRESIFDEIYKHANNVLDEVDEDETFLPIMYELDDKSEWLDPTMWIKANPGLGTIKQLDYLEQRVERAKSDVARQAGLLTKEFNILGVTDSAWLDWETINNEDTFDVESLRGSYSVGGADLSSSVDLTCATLLIEKDGVKYVLQQYFIPSEKLEEKVIEDKVPYDLWVQKGLLTLCEGVRVNYSDVTEWFKKMRDEYEVYPLWIGFDNWNANYWVEEMKANAFNMEDVIQGAKTMSGPMKEMRADLAEKKVNYNNNPILKWCLTNTVIKVDENDNIRPVKGRNQRQRIDGTVSLIDAYVIYSRHKDDYQNMQRSD